MLEARGIIEDRKEMDLFVINEGAGFPIFLSNGMVIRNELEAFWRKIHRKGYQVRLPLLSEELWHTSGHWDTIRTIFTKIDDGDYAIKPMNCLEQC